MFLCKRHLESSASETETVTGSQVYSFEETDMYMSRVHFPNCTNSVFCIFILNLYIFNVATQSMHTKNRRGGAIKPIPLKSMSKYVSLLSRCKSRWRWITGLLTGMWQVPGFKPCDATCSNNCLVGELGWSNLTRQETWEDCKFFSLWHGQKQGLMRPFSPQPTTKCIDPPPLLTETQERGLIKSGSCSQLFHTVLHFMIAPVSLGFCPGNPMISSVAFLGTPCSFSSNSRKAGWIEHWKSHKAEIFYLFCPLRILVCFFTHWIYESTPFRAYLGKARYIKEIELGCGETFKMMALNWDGRRSR